MKRRAIETIMANSWAGTPMRRKGCRRLSMPSVRASGVVVNVSIDAAVTIEASRRLKRSADVSPSSVITSERWGTTQRTVPGVMNRCNSAVTPISHAKERRLRSRIPKGSRDNRAMVVMITVNRMTGSRPRLVSADIMRATRDNSLVLGSRR